MSDILDAYAEVAGEDTVDQLRQLAESLQGKRVVHINSTKMGGGVAEILNKMVPLFEALGLDTSWEVIEGPPDFYACTKSFHNALQGNPVEIPDRFLSVYEETNAKTADLLRPKVEDADVVFVHDPQPAALAKHMPDRTGTWVWRCHIDASHPFRPVWKYLEPFVQGYDASIFSLARFAHPLPHPAYLIPPSIDPFSDKNRDLTPEEVASELDGFDIDPDRMMLLQVSRFDRFKDPVGVIQAYRLVKRFVPSVQLVLAGGGASDDPEGAQVLEEVRTAAGEDRDIHVLELPADAHTTINALQRKADIVIQKSIREGFGITVTEGLWKAKPVIGGDTGGIRLQVINHYTGFRVRTPEGAALRIRYLLHNPEKVRTMGAAAREFVRENFLLTREVREHLALILAVTRGAEDRIVVRGA